MSSLFWLGLVAKMTGTADDCLHDETTSDHERHCSRWALCPQQIYLQKQSPNAASPQIRPGQPSTTGALAATALRAEGRTVDDEVLAHISPVHSENVGFFGVIAVDVEGDLTEPTATASDHWWNPRQDDPADRMNPTRCLRRGGPLKAAPSRRAGESGSCATLSATLSTQEGTG